MTAGRFASGPAGAPENNGFVSSAPSIVTRIFREATRFDRNGLEFAFGARCAIGVALPLVAGLLTDHPLYGVSAAIGALPVGFASRQGVYRSRASAAQNRPAPRRRA